MKTISLVLPVYNEEACLPYFHKALGAILNDLDDQYRFEVIYVLDRSSDNSIDVLRSWAARDPCVTVLHMSRRFGHQNSLLAGIDHAGGDAVIMMDCDLQHPPDLIPQLLQQYEAGFDIVQTIRKYDHEVNVLKRLSSLFFYKLQNALSPLEIPEGAADFRLISRRVAQVFRTSIREQNPFLRGLFQWVGYNTAFVYFVSPSRVTGRTKYDFKRLLTFSIAGITSFSKVPLRIGSVLGLVISVISLIYGVETIINYFVSGTFPRGYASLIVAMLFIGGLQLSVLGIIGEYIGSIFDEVKRRPVYIIEEVLKQQDLERTGADSPRLTRAEQAACESSRRGAQECSPENSGSSDLC